VALIPTLDVIEDILDERRKRNRARYDEYAAQYGLFFRRMTGGHSRTVKFNKLFAELNQKFVLIVILSSLAFFPCLVFLTDTD
jgi:hypothetical protein